MAEAWVEQPVPSAAADGLRAQAHAAHRAGQLDRAEQLYKCLIGAQPEEADVANLGALLRQQGRLPEALALYRQAMQRGLRDPSLISNVANALRQAGELAASAAVLQRGLDLQPGHPPFLQGLAKTHLAQGDAREALLCLQPLLQLEEPGHELLFDLGVTHSRLGDLEAALACFERAVALEPMHGPTAANRIIIFKELGLLDRARAALDEALALKLMGPELTAARAELLMAEQQMAEAAVLFHQLCEQQPLCPGHWLNLAACWRGLKRSALPARVVKAGLSLHPAQHDLQQALFQALAELGQLQQAQRLLQSGDLNRLVEKDNHFFNLQFLATAYDLMPVAERQQLAAAWEQRRQQRGGEMQLLWKDYLPEPLPGRRLRVGYLSSDFCHHPVSRFLLPVLQSHDRTAVEVWGLHTGPHWDGMSEQIQQACDQWLNLRACTDLQAARMISDQRLDVLIELGGYTGNSRVGLCLHGAAPVQVSYLGYPGATFLESVPWWVGDATLFAHLSEQERRHQLVTIEGGYMCLPRPSQAPAPERKGSQRFRFASFNHARKLTDATLELWAELLHRAPTAELVLKSISFLEDEEAERIRERCQRMGLALDRLVLLPSSEDLAEHLAQYNQVDVALDPIPYGGATTTAEALWMGVPVVSLHGAGMAGSLSASLLQSADQPQWLAHSKEHYLALALNLMSEGVRSASQRLALISQIEASALNQPRRVSRELERFFLEATLSQIAET